MPKLLLTFLLPVIALIWLTSCSGGSGDDSNPSQTSAPPETNTPQPTAQAGRFNGPVIAMAPVPNGNGDVYVAGHFTSYNNQPVRPVVRLRPDGTLNDRFQLTDAITPPASDTRRTPVIAAADDGSADLYIGEDYDAFATPDDRAQVWKVTSAGMLAPGFTPGTLKYIAGITPGPLAKSIDLFSIVPVGDGSGRVYVGGFFDRYNDTAVSHLLRLNPDGTVDGTFSSLNTGVAKVLPAKDGSGDLYVMTYGQVGPSSFAAMSVERRNANGTADADFATFRPIDGPPASFTLTEDGSGDLFVTGGFLRIPENTVVARPGFVRLNPDGSLDETSPRLNPDVSPDPTSTWPQLMFPNFLTKATDATNDWFGVRGISTNGVITGHQLQRHKADGTLDPNFSLGQSTGTDAATEECVCAGINLVMPAPDATGDVLVAGGFTSFNSAVVGNIVRIHSNGTLVAPSSQ